MTHAQIVACYSDAALEGIIRQLAASGEWQQRLAAARHEMRRRIEEESQIENEETNQYTKIK